MQLTFSDHFQTIFRPFPDRFQSNDFRENGLKNGLNVSDRFKTEVKVHSTFIPLIPKFPEMVNWFLRQFVIARAIIIIIMVITI